VAGDFKPNPHSFLEETQALWGDAPRLVTTSRISRTEIQDKTGKSLQQGRRGYLDPRLDARWQEITVGEVRQAVGRSRPWNTGNDQHEQGQLVPEETVPSRRLDVLILSSYALDHIPPDQLTGPRADLEDVLTAAAVELRRAGCPVTLTALRAKTGISDRQIRQRFNRVKLRAEAEFFTIQAALQTLPALHCALQVILETSDATLPNPFDENSLSRRGPPLSLASL